MKRNDEQQLNNEQSVNANADAQLEPYWIVMIRELVDGAGYTYSRIARRIGVSPSTIQKLATHHDRQPRHIVFHKILCLYYKVFHGPYRSAKIEEYMKQKELDLLNNMPQEWLKNIEQEVKNNVGSE